MGDFLYGQYPKGARTTQNTIDLKFSQFSIPLLTMFYQFAWASLICQGRYFQAFPFRKTGLALYISFIPVQCCCRTRVRFIHFHVLVMQSFQKLTGGYEFVERFIFPVGEVAVAVCENFSLYINDIYRLTFNKSLVNIRLIVISRR